MLGSKARYAGLGLSVLLSLSSAALAAGKGKPKTARRAPAASYRAHVQKWHTRLPDASAPLDASGRPKLVLEAINTGVRVELSADTDTGGFAEAERIRASEALRDAKKNRASAVNEKLLNLLYRLQRHFDAPAVRVVSAFRAGGRSEHARGTAADIVLPGVADSELAAHARSFGGGVGLYPTSGFVHVDVRSEPHYWVDSSGPGQKSKARRGPHPTPKKRGAKARPNPHGG